MAIPSRSPEPPPPFPWSRQPLFLAAAAYAAGILWGSQTWRPSMWWLVAAVVCGISAALLIGRRLQVACGLAIAALLFLGALSTEAPPPADSGSNGIASFADGREVPCADFLRAELARQGTP